MRCEGYTQPAHDCVSCRRPASPDLRPCRRMVPSTLRYSETPEPVTAYQKAAQVWDGRIGSARAQAHNWRLMALGSLVASYQ